MIDHLHRLLRYDIWANRETVNSLKLNPAAPKSLRWMAHILGAEHLWLARLHRRQPRLSVWPDFDIEACGTQLEELSRLWPAYLAGLSSGQLGETISYTNSKGESWTNTVEEILTHVTIHSAYHRGQIAADLRSAGSEPAYTDYIHAARQRMLE
ncbi:MAG TPA: DinB family protein [Gemmatimonadales bacterium]|nr:DinB family protein [Gemmatimonadales bacterium]